MNILKALNLGLAFIIELLILIIYGIFGFRLLPAGTAHIFRYGLDAVFVAVFVLVWANFFAPRAARRLPMPWLLIGKLIIMFAGVLMLLWMGYTTFAVVLIAMTLVHYPLALVWKQI